MSLVNRKIERIIDGFTMLITELEGKKDGEDMKELIRRVYKEAMTIAFTLEEREAFVNMKESKDEKIN